MNIKTLPFGYSKNVFPKRKLRPTHVIVGSRVPIYDRYPDSYVRLDPELDQDKKGNIVKFLSDGDQVLAYNYDLGHNAEWIEVSIDQKLAKNLFVHSSFLQETETEEDRHNLPPKTYVNKIESRNYDLSKLVWQTRQQGISYYDSSYAKYFVKVDLQFHNQESDSLEYNLHEVLLVGTRTLLQQNAKKVPDNFDVSWCTQYDHFFQVFDYTLESRGESYNRIVALVGIDQRYFKALPADLSQLPQEYSQPSLYNSITEFYERFPEKRQTETRQSYSSNYRPLDSFLDPYNGVLDFTKTTETLCALDPRWCEYGDTRFNIRGNEIQFNWTQPIFAPDVSSSESRAYINQTEKTINYQTQKMIDDYFSDNEYADRASSFLSETRDLLSGFNSSTTELFNAIESLTIALDNAPPIQATTEAALSALQDPSLAAESFRPQEISVNEYQEDLVKFYNENTTYDEITLREDSENTTSEQEESNEYLFTSKYVFPTALGFYKQYYLKEFKNLKYIRVLPFRNYDDLVNTEKKLKEIFDGLKKQKNEYQGKIYNFDPDEDINSLRNFFTFVKKKLDRFYEDNPLTVEIHLNDKFEIIFAYINQIDASPYIALGDDLKGGLSKYPNLQKKRTSYYIAELLDIINKGIPSDIKVWTDEFTRFPEVEYVPRFKNIARKEKQARISRQNERVINNVLKEEKTDTYNSLGTFLSGSIVNTEYVASGVDTAVQVTDDLINDINSIDDTFSKYLDKQAVDNPVEVAILRCLIPQIDLSLLPETEDIQIIKEAIDTVELALESSRSLVKGTALAFKQLGISTSDPNNKDNGTSGSTKKEGKRTREKWLNLIYLEAVKANLKILQAFCLQAQKLILQSILALLSPNENEEQQSISMGNIIRKNDDRLNSLGQRSSDINVFNYLSEQQSSSDNQIDPLELQRYFSDVSGILSPIEFCSVFSRQTVPSYILDIMFNLLTIKYQSTLLPYIINRGELLDVVSSVSDFVDRDMCDQLVEQYQTPVEGYSHTVLLCDETLDLRAQLLESSAEVFGIPAETIDEISRNQNENNMSILRELLNDISSPNEVLIDVISEVRNSEAGREYYSVNYGDDVISASLQDFEKFNEFINDTKELKMDLALSFGSPGVMLPHYKNGFVYVDKPGAPFDIDNPEFHNFFLPFPAFIKGDKQNFDEIQKRNFIENTYSYYKVTPHIFDDRDILREGKYIDSRNYDSDLPLFSFMNTGTASSINSTPIDNLHSDINENDIGSISYIDSKNQKKPLYSIEVNIAEEDEPSSIWGIIAGVIVTAVVATVAVLAAPIAAVGLGAYLGISAATAVLAGVVAGGITHAVVVAGTPTFRRIMASLRKNDTIKHILNLKVDTFLEGRNLLSTIELRDDQATTIQRGELDADSEKIWKKNKYYEEYWIANNKRNVFPNIEQLFEDLPQAFESNFSIDSNTGVIDFDDIIIHDSVISKNLLSLQQNVPIGSIGISDYTVDQFAPHMRNIFSKYYAQDTQEFYDKLAVSLVGKSSRISFSDNKTHFIDVENFRGQIHTSSVALENQNIQQDREELSDIISDSIYDSLLQSSSPSVFLHEGLYDYLGEETEDVVKSQIKRILYSRLSSKLSDSTDYKSKISNLFRDSKLADLFSKFFRNSSEILGLSELNSRTNDYERIFSSGISAIDSGNIESEISLEERCENYFNCIALVKTFLYETILTVLPYFLNKTINQNIEKLILELSYKELYRYLQKSDELIFKAQIIRYLNIYYYFLNQEECRESNIEDPNYAVKETLRQELILMIRVLKDKKIINEDNSNEDDVDLITTKYDVLNYARIWNRIGFSTPSDSFHDLNNYNDSIHPEFDSYIQKMAEAAQTYDNGEVLSEILSGQGHDYTPVLSDVASYYGTITPEKLTHKEDTTDEERAIQEKINNLNKRSAMFSNSYHNAVDISITEALSGEGVIWSKVLFEVEYLDDTKETLSGKELSEIVKPYMDYKIDNLRLVPNKEVYNMRVPFVSNKNLGKWKNTKIVNSPDNPGSWIFKNLEFLENRNFTKFKQIKQIKVKLVPHISYPFSTNKVPIIQQENSLQEGFLGYKNESAQGVHNNLPSSLFRKSNLTNKDKQEPQDIFQFINDKYGTNYSADRFVEQIGNQPNQSIFNNISNYSKLGWCPAYISLSFNPQVSGEPGAQNITSNSVSQASISRITSVFNLDRIIRLDSLSIFIDEPIYEREEVFSLPIEEAREKIVNIISDKKISQWTSQAISKIDSEDESGPISFYKNLIKFNEFLSYSDMILIKEIMQKYVFNMGEYNFFSMRNVLKNQILDITSTQEEVEEEKVSTMQEFVDNLLEKEDRLKEYWNDTEAWVRYGARNQEQTEGTFQTTIESYQESQLEGGAISVSNREINERAISKVLDLQDISVSENMMRGLIKSSSPFLHYEFKSTWPETGSYANRFEYEFDVFGTLYDYVYGSEPNVYGDKALNAWDDGIKGLVLPNFNLMYENTDGEFYLHDIEAVNGNIPTDADLSSSENDSEEEIRVSLENKLRNLYEPAQVQATIYNDNNILSSALDADETSIKIYSRNQKQANNYFYAKIQLSQNKDFLNWSKEYYGEGIDIYNLFNSNRSLEQDIYDLSPNIRPVNRQKRQFIHDFRPYANILDVEYRNSEDWQDLIDLAVGSGLNDTRYLRQLEETKPISVLNKNPNSGKMSLDINNSKSKNENVENLSQEIYRSWSIELTDGHEEDHEDE